MTEERHLLTEEVVEDSLSAKNKGPEEHSRLFDSHERPVMVKA